MISKLISVDSIDSAGQQMRAESEGASGEFFTNWQPVNNRQHLIIYLYVIYYVYMLNLIFNICYFNNWQPVNIVMFIYVYIFQYWIFFGDYVITIITANIWFWINIVLVKMSMSLTVYSWGSNIHQVSLSKHGFLRFSQQDLGFFIPVNGLFCTISKPYKMGPPRYVRW